MKNSLLWSLMALMSLCAAFTAAQHLLLAGGGLTKESDFFWRKLVQLSGGISHAKIGIITAGRENPTEESATLIEILKHYGAKVEWIPMSQDIEDSANEKNTANLVSKQRAIFVDDGDPLKIIRLLRNADGTDSLVLSAMRNVLKRGVVAGSGAGASVLSGLAVILSGDSYETLVHGSRAFADAGSRRPGRKFQGSFYVPNGLNFLQSWVVETRFNEQTLHGRTIRVLLDTREGQTSPARAIGIDQEMALAIYRVGTEDEFAEVLGNRAGVTVLDATGAHFQTSPKLGISGVNVTFLTEDDKLILATKEILPASWKSDLTGEEWHFVAQSSQDIFSAPHHENRVPSNFNKIAKRLFDSALTKRMTSTSWQTSPQLVVEMDRRSADSFHNDSPSMAMHVISYVNLRVGISQQSD